MRDIIMNVPLEASRAKSLPERLLDCEDKYEAAMAAVEP